MLLLISPLLTANDTYPTAFYYGPKLPVDLLGVYPRVVVEPGNVTQAELTALRQKGATVYAYLSVGEVATSRPWSQDIQSSWKAGENTDWNSIVVDLTQPGWHQYLLKKRMKHLWDMGYRGFFLDTLDSYQLFAKTDVKLKAQQAGLARLIQAMVKHYPKVSLLLNRGFEVLDQIAPLADGIVAESLYAGWNPAQSKYRAVPANDRAWLTKKLTEARDRYHLPVTVIDYLPPHEREQAQQVADQISDSGFTPWVSVPSLDYMGVGGLKLHPRKILFLYDSSVVGHLPFIGIHMFMALPTEYLGYVPIYHDLSTGLPEYTLKGRYSGIVAWFSKNKSEHPKLLTWLSRQVQDKLPIAFLNVFPFEGHNSLITQLGMESIPQNLQPPAQLETLSSGIGFEFKPVARTMFVPVVHAPKSHAQVWLRVRDAQQNYTEPVFTANWGGVALAPYLLTPLPKNARTQQTQERWLIDPFKFLSEALKLKPIPAPDVTTENGRRILTAHIDGDGFYNKSEFSLGQYSSEVIMKHFIQGYSLPQTVSIIEGEIGPEGLKPELSHTLENIAKAIFKSPNVEIASHSFSHPFHWAKAEAQSKQDDALKRNIEKGNLAVYKATEGYYHLPIPGGYEYKAEREVEGSIDYINTRLAPDGKLTKVMLWTGNCLPNVADLASAARAGVTNMNGGDTLIRTGLNSITHVAPSGIEQGSYFQPYAPAQNENVYTNNWLGPYYGYQRVLETFEMTDKPRRLKPVSIYYHFYSGDKTASVRALKRVFDWASQQETLPMWISEYTPQLFASREAVYQQLPEGGWRIHAGSGLRTLRIPTQWAPPDLNQSRGVAGYRTLDQGTYIALTGNRSTTLYFKQTTDLKQPYYLHNSNARLLRWQQQGKQTRLQLRGHQPVELTLVAGHGQRCSITGTDKQTIKTRQNGSFWHFRFAGTDTGDVRLRCD